MGTEGHRWTRRVDTTLDTTGSIGRDAITNERQELDALDLGAFAYQGFDESHSLSFIAAVPKGPSW